MTTYSRVPIYFKLTTILIGAIAFIFILYIGQEIILPLLYAAILSIILNPLVILLERKVQRVLAITIVVVLGSVLVVLLFYMVGLEAMKFRSSLPGLEQKMVLLENKYMASISTTTGLDNDKLGGWLRSIGKGLISGDGVLGKTVASVSQLIVSVILLPVYVFLMLYYLPLLLEFTRRLFPNKNHAAVVEVLLGVKTIFRSYLLGLVIKVIIVAVLNSLTLFALRIQYALLIGIITALISLIPFIGEMIAAILPMLIAVITRDFYIMILVFSIYCVIQFIDNHYIMPIVVASKIKLNALVAIVSLLFFDALWGLPGMFLSIPLTAIVKIIFDEIGSLKAWGYLLGDDMPPIQLLGTFFRKKQTRK